MPRYDHTQSASQDLNFLEFADTQASQYDYTDFTAPSQSASQKSQSKGLSSSNRRVATLDDNEADDEIDTIGLPSLSLSSQPSQHHHHVPNSSSNISSKAHISSRIADDVYDGANAEALAFEETDADVDGIDFEAQDLPEHACKCVVLCYTKHGASSACIMSWHKLTLKHKIDTVEFIHHHL